MAHYERQVFAAERAPNYWEHSEVRGEIFTAYKHALGDHETTPDPALSAPAKRLDWVLRNWFAYALMRTAYLEQARCQIRIVGKRPIQPHPWQSLTKYKLVLRALGFEVWQNDDEEAPVVSVAAVEIV